MAYGSTEKGGDYSAEMCCPHCGKEFMLSAAKHDGAQEPPHDEEKEDYGDYLRDGMSEKNEDEFRTAMSPRNNETPY